jgi:hypothetical protein
MIRAPNREPEPGSMHPMRRLHGALLLLALALVAARIVGAAAPEGAGAPGPAASQAETPPAAVAGVWGMTVETSAGVATPKVKLEQHGRALTGTYSGRFGDQPLTGTVDGAAIRFTVAITGPMGSADVVYAGTVDGDLMQGTMRMGPGMEGRFTARRQP